MYVLGSGAKEEGGDCRGGNHHVKHVRGRKLSVEAIRGITEEERQHTVDGGRGEARRGERRRDPDLAGDERQGGREGDEGGEVG
jgi:hypothetical protein